MRSHVRTWGRYVTASGDSAVSTDTGACVAPSAWTDVYGFPSRLRTLTAIRLLLAEIAQVKGYFPLPATPIAMDRFGDGEHAAHCIAAGQHKVDLPRV